MPYLTKRQTLTGQICPSNAFVHKPTILKRRMEYNNKKQKTTKAPSIMRWLESFVTLTFIIVEEEEEGEEKMMMKKEQKKEKQKKMMKKRKEGTEEDDEKAE